MRNILRICVAALATGVLPFTQGAEPMNDEAKSKPAKAESVVLGGGCFWCLEAMYQQVPGVTKVVSGYAGGYTEKPTYKDVCNGGTGHAEVVRVEFDPAKLTLDDVLELFWEAHDPTTLNRQGADIGDQYRSIILCENDAQKQAAEKSLAAAQAKFSDKIVTQIVPLTKFHEGEGYHQDYYNLNPNQPYCRAVIGPKLEKFRKKLRARHGG
jgi:peptide-methionine (S)-S-oxide reductase